MKPTGITREQLLAGVTRHNKGEFHAREDSEEAPAIVGAEVEDSASAGEDAAAGDPGGSLRADKKYIPEHEVSLEKYLHAKVISSRVRIKSIESEIAYTRHELDERIARRDRMCMEADLALRILEKDYGHDAEGSTEGKVPETRRRHKAKTKENR